MYCGREILTKPVWILKSKAIDDVFSAGSNRA